MATRQLEPPATFRTKVNLVLVPVIVRDRKGKAIGNLKKEDFEVFDKGKPQTIERFVVEKAGSRHVEFEPEAPTGPENKDSGAPAVTADPLTVAERFTIFLFDDLHLAISDLMQSRIAAEKHLSAGLLDTERVSIATTSGKTTLEMTEDRQKVVQAMRAVLPSGFASGSRRLCPPMGYLQADMIANKNDVLALKAATQDAIGCLNLDPSDPLSIQTARQTSLSTAQQVVTYGETDTRLTVTNLRNLIKYLSTLPGQRNIVLISPGFYTAYTHSEITEVVDLAIRNRVTISSLDARGLHLVGMLPDASERTFSIEGTIARSSYDRQEAMATSSTLSELSEGTGGAFFQNSNDLTGGFAKLTATPDYTYILGFSPQNLRLDGSLHLLRVKLKDASLAVQARRGYYAPKHLADPAEEARREIQEALFSREVLRDLPVELHSQYFKASQYDAKLGVLARVDLAQLRYKRVGDRNENNLTVVAALFDRNGNYLKGSSKIVEMKLKDETLQNKTRSVVTFKTNFDVQVGGYVIRLVVRDSEGQLMAAQNGSVVIP